jgi:NADPH:quinone reductase-like Zn-dependent oxidoreductase
VEVVNREGGADMVVDHIGGSHLARSFKCLRPEGNLFLCSGFRAGRDAGDGGRADPFAVLEFLAEPPFGAVI